MRVELREFPNIAKAMASTDTGAEAPRQGRTEDGSVKADLPSLVVAAAMAPRPSKETNFLETVRRTLAAEGEEGAKDRTRPKYAVHAYGGAVH